MTEHEKDQHVREYIKRTDPYKPLKPLKFDLRGYAACLDAHAISGKDVPESVTEKFFRHADDGESWTG